MFVSAENDPRRAGTIWMLDLEQATPAVTPLVPATFGRIKPETASQLTAELDPDLASEMLNRFEHARQCYAVWVDGKLAAYGWVSLDEELIGELSLRIKLLPGEAYIWDCVTLPAFRRSRLYSALLTYITAELHTEGLRRAWIGADLDNMASQRGLARAGFQHVADLVIARVFAMRLAWVQGRPAVPDHLVAEARRAFLDNRDKVWLASLSAAVQD
jgi:ribosomal protein S18 acetylase RimI-like enzyme